MSTINLNDVLPSYLMFIFTTHALFVLLGFFLLLSAFLLIREYIKIKTLLDQKYSLLEIKPSYKSLKSSFSTRQLFSVIHSIQRPVSLLDKVLQLKRVISCELVSTKEKGIRYILRVPTEDVSMVKKSFLAYLSSVEITEIEDYLLPRVESVVIRELNLAKPYVYLLQDQLQLEESDPIAYLTGQMTKLHEDELISIQIVSTPVSPSAHEKITQHIHTLKQLFADNEDIADKINPNIFSPLLTFIMGSTKKKMSELSSSKKNIYQAIENKINQPLFEVTLRILILSPIKGDRLKRIKGILSSFETFTSPSQSLRLRNTFFTYIRSTFFDSLRYYFFKRRLPSLISNLILSTSELSAIYHFPFTSTTKTEDLVKNKSPKLPSPLSFKSSNTDFDITFADNTYGETTTPIGLILEERRRHVYAIGATGTGKTTMLLQMIYQDIIHDKGLAVVDPHGDLAERLLGVIPKKRLNDVVYFNPYDIDYPLGLNVLEMTPNLSETEKHREKDLITSTLISIFHKLYPPRYSGPRMEHVLRNTVLTALEVESPTLFTVYKLLTNKIFRKQVVSKITDPILKDFWNQEFGKMGSYQQAELISPITNKLGRFLTTKMTRNILNQEKSKLNFDDIMNSGKILICDLSKGKIGEDTSSFLGSLLIAKIQLAALKRVHTPQEDRKDFFLYIDEFQNFATMPFAQILSEARKYRLNTILAHQTISQIEDKDLLKVILANVGTVISFRTSNPSDEDIILPLLTPQVEKNEISNLPSYNFYIKINALSPQDAFTGSISNFSIEINEETRKTVIENSRLNYGMKMEKSVIFEKSTSVQKPEIKVQKNLPTHEKRRVSI